MIVNKDRENKEREKYTREEETEKEKKGFKANAKRKVKGELRREKR